MVARKTWIAHTELVEQARDQRLVDTLALGTELVTGPVRVGGVEQRDTAVESAPDRVGELVAWHGAGLVEGHEAEPDRADLNSSYGVVSIHVAAYRLPCPRGGPR